VPWALDLLGGGREPERSLMGQKGEEAMTLANSGKNDVT